MTHNLQNKVVTIFGGTGFLGRYAVAELARQGATVKVVTRHPASAYFLRQFGTVGQIVPYLCNYKDSEIERAVAGSDCVVNCLGILFEKGKSSFQKIHVDTAAEIATACAGAGVKRFVHISALGVGQSKSVYARTKRDGEAAVRRAFPAVTILRPGVAFGPEDEFFNKFASLAAFLPFLPVIGTGKLQPVYAGDVGAAVLKALTMADAGPHNPLGKTFELGGPEILDFKGIYAKLFAQTGRTRATLRLPEPVARAQAAFFSLLPTPPLTGDQITSLKSDSIVEPGALSLSDLGLQPTALDAILPLYLSHYRKGGKFADRERA